MIARLAQRLARRPAAERPAAWLTYHLYHKAPDYLGPVVCDALAIPYLVAEASSSAKQADGPWACGHRSAAAAIARADAVFGLDAPGTVASPPPPRLGVLIGGSAAGVAVIDVVDGSVAEAEGIRAGDVIVEAAGVAVREPGDLIAIVDRQAPGTWLPLRVARDGAPLEIVAKFPASR